jgi:predicted CXXCH cytochrome family protein
VRHYVKAWLAALALTTLALAQQDGVVVRPTNDSAFPEGEVTVIARAPGGRLELDGEPIEAEAPFPDVLQARITPPPGEHTIALIWEEGRQEVRFFVGGNPPESYRRFRTHPPTEVECTQCHGVSRRGRFRFTGGCFDCHDKEEFGGAHQHEPHELESCGLCHNAHGAPAKALMILPRKTACQQCHDLPSTVP